MKDQLLKLYQKRHEGFKKIKMQFPDKVMGGPFLISSNKDYIQQKNSLLIVGQETYGWYDHVDDLERQMKRYEEFNVGEKYYASPFWNITRKVERALGNSSHSCSWTNISKYDLDGRRSFGEYERAISALDDILIDEIKILKPQICLFFTGPYFDQRIKSIYPAIEFLDIPDWPLRQFCRLKHPDLPELTFRSYHPKSLRIRKLEGKFIDFISTIAN